MNPALNSIGSVLFTHVDHETDVVTNINVSTLSRDRRVKALKVERAPVDLDFAKFCLTNRGVEKHRLARLMDGPIREPILVCEWYDDTHLIVDGHHRYVASARRGFNAIKAKIIPKHVWMQHIVVGICPEVSKQTLTQFSGIA